MSRLSKCRTAFEVWCLGSDANPGSEVFAREDVDEGDSSRYRHFTVQVCWAAWQASCEEHGRGRCPLYAEKG